MKDELWKQTHSSAAGSFLEEKIRMDAVDEYQTGHVSRIGARVHVSVQGSRRIRYQHVRRRDPCRPQESMQIAGLGRTIARVRAGVAPAGTWPIIPARRRVFCRF